VRRRNLQKLYIAETASGIGDGVMWVALISALADEQRYGLWLSLAVLVRLGPRALFSIPAGSLVDRVGPQTLLVTVDSVRALLLAGTAALAWAGSGPIPILAAILVSKIVAVPSRPALSAALPRVSGETHLAAANATLSTIRQVMTFVGPLIGVAVVAWSTTGGYLTNAIGFAVSAAALAAVRGVPWPDVDRPAFDRLRALRSGRRLPSLSGSFRSGVGSVRLPGMPALIGLIGAVYFLRGAETVLYVLVVRDLIGATPSSFGYLAGAVGVGAVLATPMARRGADSARPVAMLAIALTITVVPTALLAGSTDLALSALLLLPVGAGVVLFEVVSVVTLQRTAHPHALGRVFGAVTSASNTGQLLGAIVAAPVALWLGTDVALIVLAAAVAISGSLTLPSVRTLTASAQDRRLLLEPLVEVLDQVELFDGASRPVLERVAAVVIEETIDTDTIVIHEGAESNDLFLARTGTFDVSVAGHKINEMGPGSWFGEIGLIDRSPRTATVVATSPSVVWRIPGDVFLAVLDESGSPPTALVEGVAARLATGRAV
jgi:MFS family permease